MCLCLEPVKTRRGIRSPGTELLAVVNCHVDGGIWTRGLGKSSQCAWPLRHLSVPRRVLSLWNPLPSVAGLHCEDIFNWKRSAKLVSRWGPGPHSHHCCADALVFLYLLISIWSCHCFDLSHYCRHALISHGGFTLCFSNGQYGWVTFNEVSLHLSVTS